MKALKQQMDDLEREIQHFNDLHDQVLVIETHNEFGEAFDPGDFLSHFEWLANVSKLN